MIPFLQICIEIALGVLLLALVLASVRILRGPSLPDRIIAVDLFGTLCVAAIALLALYTDQPVFIDAAIALALVAFFGTVAYARFVERRTVEETNADD
ncbi:monovalent cation/H+ antiporter complex subunit F [Oleisolibacter albus]|uniref:monovalent cation/H+ antiporter complex subunit F n=1 Tax=Oleisolibacter albus TaxID=2171757 RepID=UPI000DF3FC3F|nr:cation:proton antiporter [Oleisolibacter albus]